MSSRASRTLYVGNLPGDIREREVEDLFYKYGPVAHIDLKIPPRPPGYAFVEFEEARDAEDAIRGRDGYDFDGHWLRVELAHGGRSHSSSDRHSSYSSGRGRGVSRRSEYRVLVTGLPSSASWQDLKDHMRRAGDVCFSQVFRNGNGTTGFVDYTNYDDMKHAIKKLDDSEFRNAFSRAYVRVREYDASRDGSRSPGRGRSFQEAKVKAAVVVIVTVRAGVGASLQKPNLHVALLIDLDQGLPRVLALDQSHAFYQDLDQDPDLLCPLVSRSPSGAEAEVGARVIPVRFEQQSLDVIISWVKFPVATIIVCISNLEMLIEVDLTFCGVDLNNLFC